VFVERRARDYREADLTADDIAALRAAGFDDRAIHDICAVVAYYAFVNRLADGLGVELEPRLGGVVAGGSESRQGESVLAAHAAPS
jgi:hypothetical protein